MNSSPSLFKHATKELSQDAFISWLLEWGDEKYEGKALYNCSIDLIKTLFFGKKLPSFPTTVEVKKQVFISSSGKNKKRIIDILCFVGTKDILLIEDKTNTSDGVKKLTDYQDGVIANNPNQNIHSIYFKTGFQLDFTAVHEAGYQEFLRDDLYKILDVHKSKINNDIFLDYYLYLENKVNKTASYIETPFKEWKGLQWQGFYKEVHKEIGNSNGGYVHNQDGGFWGFWWRECNQFYFQIEKINKEYSLCIKIVKNKDQIQSLSSKKNMFEVINKSFLKEGINFRKPSRFASGKHMTIAVLHDPFIKEKNGKIDIAHTIKFFKSLGKVTPFKAST